MEKIKAAIAAHRYGNEQTLFDERAHRTVLSDGVDAAAAIVIAGMGVPLIVIIDALDEVRIIGYTDEALLQKVKIHITAQ